MALSTALAVSPTPDWIGGIPLGIRPRSVLGEKGGDVLPYTRGCGCTSAKEPISSGRFGFDHADDFFGIHLYDGRPDSVVGAEQGNGLAVGRVFRFVNVMESAQARRMEAI